MNPLWNEGECFFVSEDSPLLNSFNGPLKRFFVTPFALSELKRRQRINVLHRIARNFVESFHIIYREKPDIIVSTGAGSVFFTILFGRLSGAKVVIIETFSRYTSLSKFALITAPFASERILQTQSLTTFWPTAKVFDPIKVLPPKLFSKKDMILVTVGATLPFDRMVQAVTTLQEAGRVSWHVIYQVGSNGARPSDGEFYQDIPYETLKEILLQSKIVVCHGGSGSIVPALEAGCHVISFARKSTLGEHFDDHQQDLTRAFEARGLIQLAWDAESLAEAIERTSKRNIVRVKSDMSELCLYIKSRIAHWFPSNISAGDN